MVRSGELLGLRAVEGHLADYVATLDSFLLLSYPSGLPGPAGSLHAWKGETTDRKRRLQTGTTISRRRAESNRRTGLCRPLPLTV